MACNNRLFVTRTLGAKARFVMSGADVSAALLMIKWASRLSAGGDHVRYYPSSMGAISRVFLWSGEVCKG